MEAAPTAGQRGSPAVCTASRRSVVRNAGSGGVTSPLPRCRRRRRFFDLEVGTRTGDVMRRPFHGEEHHHGYHDHGNEHRHHDHQIRRKTDRFCHDAVTRLALPRGRLGLARPVDRQLPPRAPAGRIAIDSTAKPPTPPPTPVTWRIVMDSHNGTLPAAWRSSPQQPPCAMELFEQRHMAQRAGKLIAKRCNVG